MNTTPETSLAPRPAHSLSQDGMRWWQGYEQTEGLDAFRADERYAVWRHTHLTLVAADLRYATDTRWFWMCGLLTAAMVLAIWAYVGLFSTAATIGLATATLLCCREQRRRNACISEQLRVPA